MQQSRARAAMVAVALFTFVAGRAMAYDDDARGSEVVLEGVVEVVQSCDFEGKRHARSYFLHDQNRDQRFELKANGNPKAEKLTTGVVVRVRGNERGGTVDVGDGASSLEVIGNVAEAVTGGRKALLLVVDFANGASPVSCSDTAVAGILWTNALNVDGYYQESSFGNVSWPSDTDGNGSPDVFRVAIADQLATTANGLACNYNTWATNADAAATAAGIDLSLYQHRVYVIPSGNSSCGWAGLANVLCMPGTCRAWIKSCGTADVYAHEVGHNLNLAHASTDFNNDGTIDSEYGDNSDTMGIGGVGWRHNNGPHKDQEGWFPVGKVVDAGTGGTFTLAPVETNPGATGFAQLVKVAKGNSPGTSYWVSYRRGLGSYSGNLSSTYAERTSVHRYSSGYSNTHLLALLGDGQSWSDPANGVTITQVSHDTASATVQVATSCTVGAPNASISPASQGGAPGSTKTYTLSVTNTDSAACGSSVFDLAASVPSGWSGSVSTASLTIGAGASGSATLSVTAAAGATNGTHPVGVAVSSTTEPLHAGTASASFVVDAQAPNSISNLAGSLNKQKKPALTWTVPSDNGGSGVVRYYIHRNNGATPYANTTSTSYVDSSVTAGQTYTYRVVAEDAAGNRGTGGNTVSLTVPSKGGGKPGR